MKTLMRTRPWVLACVLGVGAVFAGAGYAAPAWEAGPEVTAAILNEDWRTVATRLESGPGLPPASRAIKAHAYLATNRNNESVCLFRSLAGEDELRQWNAWTQGFAARHPDKAMAHYLRGDALARLGQWDEALKAFNRALALQPDNSLALNARGIAHAAKGLWDDALRDFDRATRSNPLLADAHASWGAMWIQRRTGAPGALRSSDEALKRSPDFVLALIGRAGAYVALQRWPEAERSLRTAAEKGGCVADLVAENIVRILAYMNGEGQGVQVALGPETEAGTTLDKHLRDLHTNPSQQTFNALTSYLGNNPRDLGRALGELRDHAAVNTEWGQKVLGFANNNVNWNTGLGQSLPSILGGLHGSAEAPLGKVKVEGGYRFDHLATELGRTTHQNLGVARPMEQTLSDALRPFGNPGGVTTDLSAAHVDAGDWPFLVPYGLLYPVPGASILEGPKGEAR